MRVDREGQRPKEISFMPRVSITVRFVGIAACGFAFVLTGCGPKKQPTRTTTQPNPQPEVMTNTDTRMSELRQRSQELNQAAQQLPGRAAADDRRLVADAFGKAAASLELLGGPQPGGAFRQQLRIVENTRDFLGSSASVAPDPSIDTGLRSIENALGGVREQLFPNDPKVKSQLENFRTRLAELDSVRGPIHSLVVAQAFQSAANVIDTMSSELDVRNTAMQQQQQQPPMAAQPAPAARPAPPAPVAIPAAASAPPAPAAAAPAALPRQAAPPAPPAPPASSATLQQQYDQLQKEHQRLQQQYQELQQKYQQQQQPPPR
jgi:hypothetical protein